MGHASATMKIVALLNLGVRGSNPLGDAKFMKQLWADYGHHSQLLETICYS